MWGILLDYSDSFCIELSANKNSQGINFREMKDRFN